MREKYFVYKNTFTLQANDFNFIEGYKFFPKNNLDYGFNVKEVTVFKFNLIKKILQKKIRNKLNLFIEYLINNLDDNDSEDSRKALDEVQRYRNMVNANYKLYLDTKYLELLNNKFNVIENELKANIIYNNIEVEEVHKSR